MNFSNQEISFQMQGTLNQHLYQLQIVVSLVLILLGEGKNRKVFITSLVNKVIALHIFHSLMIMPIKGFK
jgi:hypothetical protein